MGNWWDLVSLREMLLQNFTLFAARKETQENWVILGWQREGGFGEALPASVLKPAVPVVVVQSSRLVGRGGWQKVWLEGQGPLPCSLPQQPAAPDHLPSGR